jgi:hypothetical protein
MIIAAKFASACGRCSKAISPGSKVEWAPGTRAAHVACVKGAAPVAAPRRPAGRWNGCAACASRGKMCQQCAFDEFDD